MSLRFFVPVLIRKTVSQKACDAFEKDSSLPPAETWLNVYAPRIISRLKLIVPDLAPELSNMDILAMQELCGYETIATGSSEFCKVFTDEEWLDVEYYFDVSRPWVSNAYDADAGQTDPISLHDGLRSTSCSLPGYALGANRSSPSSRRGRGWRR